jgi:hypothetical protein
MMLRSTFAIVALVAALSAPAACFAQDNNPPPVDEGPSMFNYGLRGFWTGAEVGLAAGFLATGTHYTSGEWRKLVLGAGIGAVLGVGGGITLAVVDTTASRPRSGWFVLRDMGYGSMLGALTGAAVGALFWVDHGRPKNVLTGAAVGTLTGAAVGIVFGLIEGMNSPRRRVEARRRMSQPGVEIIITALPSADRFPALVPAVAGRF